MERNLLKNNIRFTIERPDVFMTFAPECVHPYDRYCLTIRVYESGIFQLHFTPEECSRFADFLGGYGARTYEIKDKEEDLVRTLFFESRYEDTKARTYPEPYDYIQYSDSCRRWPIIEPDILTAILRYAASHSCQ